MRAEEDDRVNTEKEKKRAEMLKEKYSGWVKGVDPKFDRVYWFHHGTHQIVWKDPLSKEGDKHGSKVPFSAKLRQDSTPGSIHEEKTIISVTYPTERSTMKTVKVMLPKRPMKPIMVPWWGSCGAHGVQSGVVAS